LGTQDLWDRRAKIRLAKYFKAEIRVARILARFGSYGWLSHLPTPTGSFLSGRVHLGELREEGISPMWNSRSPTCPVGRVTVCDLLHVPLMPEKPIHITYFMPARETMTA